MMVLLVTNASKQLIGYLTRFLTEMQSGCFIGTPSVRVREKLWEKVKTTLPESGKAVLAYTIDNEQGYTYEYYNHDDREVIDLDGLQVCAKKISRSEEPKRGWSKAYWTRRKKRGTMNDMNAS